MKTKEKRGGNGVRALVESAILVAIALVLSLVKLIELPYGGSVTLASILPIILVSYRHGLAWGAGSGITFSLIQQLLGMKNLSYVHAMYAGKGAFEVFLAVAAVFLLDYVLAFSVAGLAGFFRKPVKNQALALTYGALFVSVIRFICHVISGATVWAGLSIPNEAALIYSLGYNATYMIPETIILALTAYYVGSVLDFRNESIRTLKRAEKAHGLNLFWIGGVLVLQALIIAVVFVFRELQNAETGDFMITGLANVDWKTVGLISGILFVDGIACFVVQYIKIRKEKEKTVEC